MRQRQHGVTLLEIIMTVAIVGVLSTLVVPSFGNLLHDAERTTTVNAFLQALFLARSESLKRGEIVSVCKSRDGQTCTSGSAAWRDGWLVFENKNRDEPPQIGPGEAILLVHPGWKRGTITSNRDAYSFRPFQQAVINGTLVFCDPRGAAHARAIIISHTGRPRVAQRDSNNKPLICPPS